MDPNVLFFVSSATSRDREEVIRLVRKNYPGLLERGIVSWGVLHAARTRRTSGMSKERADRIIGEFNEAVRGHDKVRLESDNLDEWPTFLGVMRQGVRRKGGPVAMPCPPPEREKQLVFGVWGEEITQYDFTEQYVVSPWRAADGTSANASYNIMLNIAVMTRAVEQERPNPPMDVRPKYPLRFILPSGKKLGPSLRRTPFTKPQESRLVAVLLLHFEVTESDRHFYDTPPHVEDRSFVPLFVFHVPGFARAAPEELRLLRTFEHYQLFNYIGHRVDWSDFSKRKKASYYELRNVMAQLRRKRWVMLRLDDTVKGAMTHYLVRPSMRTEEQEARALATERNNRMTPMCINWDEAHDSLEIEPRWKWCTYAGDGADGIDGIPLEVYDRVHFTNYSGENPDAMHELEKLTVGEVPRARDLGIVGLPSTAATEEWECDVDRPDCRGMFGMYGEEAPPGVRATDTFEHLKWAREFWKSMSLTVNPLDVLRYMWLNAREDAQEDPDAIPDAAYRMADEYHSRDRTYIAGGGRTSLVANLTIGLAALALCASAGSLR